jgi:hypothetical protein
VGGAIHELWVCSVRLLEALEFIGKPTVNLQARRVPAKVWSESTMKQIETSQFLDVETAAKIGL